MPILNDLSKKLSNVAQTTVQVSKDLAGSAKVTLAVSAEEREIEKAYRALGHWYYTTRGENPEEAGEYLDIIDTSLRKIREIRDEAEAAKTAAVQPAFFALPRWQEDGISFFSLHKTFKIMHVYIVCHAVFIYNNTSVFLR